MLICRQYMAVNVMKNSCCFFGHRKIEKTSYLKTTLYNTVRELITSGITTFYFGSKSQFDDLCYDIVSELKEEFPNIQRIYVRAQNPYLSEHYYEFLLKSYEDTYYPLEILNSGKAAYVERNFEMIDKCSFCVIYYDEKYMPNRRKISKRDILDYQPKSGTRIAYDYANKQGKNIINIYEDITETTSKYVLLKKYLTF